MLEKFDIDDCCKTLRIDKRTKLKISKILKKFNNPGLYTTSAIVYLCAPKHVTQRKVCRYFEIGPETLRKYYKHLEGVEKNVP